MNLLIYITLVLIFLFLAMMHFYWAFGGKWAFENSLPQKESGEKVLKPKSSECAIVGLLLISFAFFILIKSKIIYIILPIWLSHYGEYLLSIIFIIRAIGDFKYVGFFKKIKQTPFGRLDSKIYSPLCLLIGILLILLKII